MTTQSETDQSDHRYRESGDAFDPDDPEIELVQSRTIQTLLSSQICGGMGLMSGYTVTALLAIWSSSPKPGAMCTTPVPSSVLT